MTDSLETPDIFNQSKSYFWQWRIDDVLSSIRNTPLHVLQSRMFHYIGDFPTLWMIKIYLCLETTVIIEVIQVQGTGRHKLKLYVNGVMDSPMFFDFTNKSSSVIKSLHPFQHLNIDVQIQHDTDLQRPWVCMPIEKMSDSYEQLLTRNDTYSDLTLYCHQNKFPVHKFILTHRAPVFLQSLFVTEDNIAEVCNMSADTLRILLEYVYTGKVSRSAEQLIRSSKDYQEVIKMIEQYRFGEVFLNEFTREIQYIYTRHSLSGGGTPNRSFYHSRRITFNPEIPFQYISLAHHRLLLTARFSSQTITVTVDSLNEKDDFKVYCYLYINLIDESYPLLDVYLNDGKSLDTLEFTKERPQQDFVIHRTAENIILSITTLPFIEMNSSAAKIRNSYEFSILKWFHEMTSLSDEGSGDVTLVFGADERPLKMWKTLLAMHSPVFSRMFENPMFAEGRTQRVELPEFDFSTGLRWLKYLKTGDVEKTNFLQDAELYVFSDKYLAKELFVKCSQILYSDVELNEVSEVEMYYDVLILSDACGDVELKEIVKNYILPYHKEFKILKGNFPHLAAECRIWNRNNIEYIE